MARPKGSKNKKTVAKTIDFDAQIAAKKTELDALNAEYESVTAIIAENNAKLREIKKGFTKLNREIAKLEAKKAEIAAAALAQEKKQQAQDAIEKLLENGTSIDDILAKLK